MANLPEFMNQMNFCGIESEQPKPSIIATTSIMALHIHERRALELICLQGRLRQLYCQ